MKEPLACFKAYDIRGEYPDPLNAHFALALGKAIAKQFAPKKVVTGHDARLSGPELESALLTGIGCENTSLGLCGTEEIYFAAAHGDFDLGIMITGSHNPPSENGFKIIKSGAIPVSLDSGLKELAALTMPSLNINPDYTHCVWPQTKPVREQYLQWLLEYSGFAQLAATDNTLAKVVADAGNGCAGPMLAALAQHLPFDIIPLNFTPDGTFPNGVPNPLLPERRQAASSAVKAHKADLGVAFDGDFDRCFFFDETGQMVESCHLVGLLAQELLHGKPGSKIVHDPRVFWHAAELIRNAGGIPVKSRGGHSYMKETMRRENALYGGEMSAHHFFRDFAYCDSGMLTLLLVLALLRRSGQTLGEMTAQAIASYPCSGEINFRVQDADAAIQHIWRHYYDSAIKTDKLDGINMEFPQWRFNLRSSNTEPLLRLNVESRGNRQLLADKTGELEQLIGNFIG